LNGGTLLKEVRRRPGATTIATEGEDERMNGKKAVAFAFRQYDPDSGDRPEAGRSRS